MLRVISIFKRDFKSSIRDNMLLYMMIVPLLLALGLKLFIPSANNLTVKFAIDKSLDKEVIETFEKYGEVELYDNKDKIIQRVNKMDDIAGITLNENGLLQAVIEGNEQKETPGMAKMIIKNINRNDKGDLNFIISNIGYKMSPVASIGSASLIIVSIMLGGMIIGFNIIEEKENNTLNALTVSPMNRKEFICGKSIIGIIIPIIQSLLMLWILDLFHVNIFMILVLIVSSSLIAIVLGFLIGVLSNNQIAGIANMKGLMLLVSASILGAVLLDSSKHFLLYWSPLYWSFMGLHGAILEIITWSKVGINVLGTLITTNIIFLVAKKKIRKGLS
ncbi:MAG: ABC transporter permease [Firmicutes bacterium]|nr:ABC transporter permease [Bacillota bacterium]